MALHRARLSELTIRDERTFRHIALYERLKQRLLDDGYTFRVAAEPGGAEDWARALFLNLTYWKGDGGDDVLAEWALDADVVAHAAWHHAVGALLAQDGPPSADALLFGEAVASAFDLYLLGRTFGRTRSSTFLDSAVPALIEAAMNAGLDEQAADALIQGVVDDPDAAFESLRALLFDVTTALVGCRDVDAAAAVLASVREHPFEPILHHYELSNWVLYAQAHSSSVAPDARVRALDAAMRAAPASVDWLAGRAGLGT